MTVTCKKCGIEKPLVEYYKAKGTKTGHHSSCKTCYKQRVKTWKDSNKERVLSVQKDYYERNKDHCLAVMDLYAQENPDVVRKAKKAWRMRNAEAVNAGTAARRASKLNAQPDWLSESQKEEIKTLYWLAKDLKAISGEDYHVDHIVPLRGENICGLHVPWNLQVLPADINCSKGNKFDGCTI